MLKIYAKREEELRLLPILAEFKARVVASFPVKGHTRKIKGKNAYKIVSFPSGHEFTKTEKEFGAYLRDNPDIAEEEGIFLNPPHESHD